MFWAWQFLSSNWQFHHLSLPQVKNPGVILHKNLSITTYINYITCSTNFNTIKIHPLRPPLSPPLFSTMASSPPATLLQSKTPKRRDFFIFLRSFMIFRWSRIQQLVNYQSSLIPIHHTSLTGASLASCPPENSFQKHSCLVIHNLTPYTSPVSSDHCPLLYP